MLHHGIRKPHVFSLNTIFRELAGSLSAGQAEKKLLRRSFIERGGSLKLYFREKGLHVENQLLSLLIVRKLCFKLDSGE